MTTNLRLGALCGALLLAAACTDAIAQTNTSPGVRFTTPRIASRASTPAAAPVRSIQPTSGEVVLEGPSVVLGERGPVPVPPGRVPYAERVVAPRAARPRIVKHVADQPEAEEVPMGKLHKPEELVPEPAEGSVLVDGGDNVIYDDADGGCPGCAHRNYSRWGNQYVDGPRNQMCAPCNPCDDADCCLIPCPSVKNFMLFAGVQGFTGPPNQGFQGSFGFNEGVNWGIPIRFGMCDTGLAAQLGIRGVHANYSGSHPSFTNATRDQIFVTGGIFRRVDCGFQFGAVFDYLNDNWWYQIQLTQIRAEASWLFPCNHELGATVMTSLNNQQFTSTQTNTFFAQPGVSTWQAQDMVQFFYRYRFDDCGSNIRIFGGFSGNRDGLFGGDLYTPLNDTWAFQADFIYLIPNQAAGTPADDIALRDRGVVNEAWNVSFGFVWYPRCKARQFNYNRPLFNVANNGTMIVNQVD